MGGGVGATALRHAGEVDAVLADYRLGHGEDGLSLIAALRARRPHLPAVLITAEDRASLATRALAATLPAVDVQAATRAGSDPGAASLDAEPRRVGRSPLGMEAGKPS